MTYSYSSAGSAPGAIGAATATEPPPNVFDCKATMPAFTMTAASTGRWIKWQIDGLAGADGSRAWRRGVAASGDGVLNLTFAPECQK